MSQSTFFQSRWDVSSWVEPILSNDYVSYTCADPGIFVRGAPGQSLTFFFFYSSAYLTEVKWSILKKSSFQGSRGGPTFSRGGSNFFQGGSKYLFPIETHITCDFPGGSGPPVPPLWIRTCYTRTQHSVPSRAVAAYLKVVRRRKPLTAEGTRGGEHERGIITPLVRGGGGGWGLPREIFEF